MKNIAFPSENNSSNNNSSQNAIKPNIKSLIHHFVYPRYYDSGLDLGAKISNFNLLEAKSISSKTLNTTTATSRMSFLDNSKSLSINNINDNLSKDLLNSDKENSNLLQETINVSEFLKNAQINNHDKFLPIDFVEIEQILSQLLEKIISIYPGFDSPLDKVSNALSIFPIPASSYIEIASNDPSFQSNLKRIIISTLSILDLFITNPKFSNQDQSTYSHEKILDICYGFLNGPWFSTEEFSEDDFPLPLFIEKVCFLLNACLCSNNPKILNSAWKILTLLDFKFNYLSFINSDLSNLIEASVLNLWSLELDLKYNPDSRFELIFKTVSEWIFIEPKYQNSPLSKNCHNRLIKGVESLLISTFLKKFNENKIDDFGNTETFIITQFSKLLASISNNYVYNSSRVPIEFVSCKAIWELITTENFYSFLYKIENIQMVSEIFFSLSKFSSLLSGSTINNPNIDTFCTSIFSGTLSFLKFISGSLSVSADKDSLSNLEFNFSLTSALLHSLKKWQDLNPKQFYTLSTKQNLIDVLFSIFSLVTCVSTINQINDTFPDKCSNSFLSLMSSHEALCLNLATLINNMVKSENYYIEQNFQYYKSPSSRRNSSILLNFNSLSHYFSKFEFKKKEEPNVGASKTNFNKQNPNIYVYKYVPIIDALQKNYLRERINIASDPNDENFTNPLVTNESDLNKAISFDSPNPSVSSIESLASSNSNDANPKDKTPAAHNDSLNTDLLASKTKFINIFRSGLLFALNESVIRSSTQNFFSFNGNNCGLILPRFHRLSPKGFSVLMWFNVCSDFDDLTKNSCMVLSHLCCPNDDYFSLRFNSSSQCVEIEFKSLGKISTIICSEKIIPLETWNSVCISYCQPKKSWTSGSTPSLVVLINGSVAHTSSIEFINDGCFSSLFFGCSPSVEGSKKAKLDTNNVSIFESVDYLNLENCFKGLVSTIYMFDGPFNEKLTCTFHTLGPMYSDLFGSISDNSVTSAENFAKDSAINNVNNFVKIINSDYNSHALPIINDIQNLEFEACFDKDIKNEILLCLKPENLKRSSSVLPDSSPIGLNQSLLITMLKSNGININTKIDISNFDSNKALLISSLENCYVRQVYPYKRTSVCESISQLAGSDVFSYFPLLFSSIELNQMFKIDSSDQLYFKTILNEINCIFNGGPVAGILRLLANMMLKYPANELTLNRKSDLSLFSNLLSQNSFKLCDYLTVDVINVLKQIELEFLSMYKNKRLSSDLRNYYLSNVKSVCNEWILNTGLWRRAPFKTQLSYATELLDGLKNNCFPTSLNDISPPKTPLKSSRVTKKVSAINVFNMDTASSMEKSNQIECLTMKLILNTLRDYYSYDYSNLYPLVRSNAGVPLHYDPSIHLWKSSNISLDNIVPEEKSIIYPSLKLTKNQTSQTRRLYLKSLQALFSRTSESKNSNSDPISSDDLKIFTQHIVYMSNRDPLHSAELLNQPFVEQQIASLIYGSALLRSKQKLTFHLYHSLIAISLGLGDQMALLAISNIRIDEKKTLSSNTQTPPLSENIVNMLPHKKISSVEAISVILELLTSPSTTDQISHLESITNLHHKEDVLDINLSDSIKKNSKKLSSINLPEAANDDNTLSFDSKIKILKFSHLQQKRKEIERLNAFARQNDSNLDSLQLSNSERECIPIETNQDSLEYSEKAFNLIISILWQLLKSDINSLGEVESAVSIIWIVSPLNGSKCVQKLFENILELIQTIVYESQFYKNKSDRFLASDEEQKVLFSNLGELFRFIESWQISSNIFQKLITDNKTLLVYHKKSVVDSKILKSSLSANLNPWDTGYKLCSQYSSLLFSIMDLQEFGDVSKNKESVCYRLFWLFLSGMKSTNSEIVIKTLKSIIKTLQYHSFSFYLTNKSNDQNNHVGYLPDNSCSNQNCVFMTKYLPLLGQIHYAYSLFKPKNYKLYLSKGQSYPGSENSKSNQPAESQDISYNSHQEILVLYAIILQHYLPLLQENNKSFFIDYTPSESEVSILGFNDFDSSVVMKVINEKCWDNICKTYLIPEILKFDEEEMEYMESFVTLTLNKIREMLAYKFDSDFKEEKNSKYTESMVSNSARKALSLEFESLSSSVSLRIALADAVPPIVSFLNNSELFTSCNNLSSAITRAINAINLTLPNQVSPILSKAKDSSKRNYSTKLSKNHQAIVQKILTPILSQYLKDIKKYLKEITKFTSPRQIFYKDIESWWFDSLIDLELGANKDCFNNEINIFNVSDSKCNSWVVDQTQDKSRMLLKLVPVKIKNSYVSTAYKKDIKDKKDKKTELKPHKASKKSVNPLAVKHQINSNKLISEKQYLKQFLNFKKNSLSQEFYIIPTPDNHVLRLKCSKIVLLHEVYGYLDLTKYYIKWTVIHNNLGQPLIEYDINTGNINKHKSTQNNNNPLVTPAAILNQLDVDFSYHISDIIEIQVRTVNFKKSALEIFFRNRTSSIFHLSELNDVSELYNSILDLNPNLNKIPLSDLNQPEKLVQMSQATKKWQSGELSNFDYLMALNTLAGRSYNDLSQYPIFPWILKDYTSSKLNLNDPEIYRDLSKPIGALNPERLSKFKERYNSFEDPSGQIKKFLYGTHYSSPASLSHFLIRNEPYTSVHILLQNGKFDFADRQFHSIAEAWNSCMNSSWDVKELIPEFFYQPDFLKNYMDLDLGSKQDGVRLGDVELPPWAEGSPAKFVDINRRALESEYVSSNLHHWVDLIFGYKQSGEEAEKSDNLFYYLTYPDRSLLDSTTDQTERQSIELQIKYFGQTPCQLFFAPHPKRNYNVPMYKPFCRPLLFNHHFVINVKDALNSFNTDLTSKKKNFSSGFSTEMKSPIVHIESLNLSYSTPSLDTNNKMSEGDRLIEFSEFLLSIDATGKITVNHIELMADLNLEINEFDPSYNSVDSNKDLNSNMILSVSPLFESTALPLASGLNFDLTFRHDQFKYFTHPSRPDFLSIIGLESNFTSLSSIPIYQRLTNSKLFSNLNQIYYPKSYVPEIIPSSGALKSNFLNPVKTYPLSTKNTSTSSTIITVPKTASKVIKSQLETKSNLSLSSCSEDDFVKVTVNPKNNIVNIKSTPYNLEISDVLLLYILSENTIYSINRSYSSSYSKLIEDLIKVSKNDNKGAIVESEGFLSKSIFSAFSGMGIKSSPAKSRISGFGFGFGGNDTEVDSTSILSKKSLNEWKSSSKLNGDRLSKQSLVSEVGSNNPEHNLQKSLSNDYFNHLDTQTYNEDQMQSAFMYAKTLADYIESSNIPLEMLSTKIKSCIKISNCGCFLSVGCTDGSIYVYKITLFDEIQKDSSKSDSFSDLISKNLAKSQKYYSLSNSSNNVLEYPGYKPPMNESAHSVKQHDKLIANDLTCIMNDYSSDFSNLNSDESYPNFNNVQDTKSKARYDRFFNSFKDNPSTKLVYIGHTISHDCEVKDICLNTDLDVMVSCSFDNTVIVHSISKMKVIRTLRPGLSCDFEKTVTRDASFPVPNDYTVNPPESITQTFGSSSTSCLKSVPYPTNIPTSKNNPRPKKSQFSFMQNISVPLFSELIGKSIFSLNGVVEKVFVLPDSRILTLCYVQDPDFSDNDTFSLRIDLNKRRYFLQMFTINGMHLFTSNKMKKGYVVADWSITSNIQFNVPSKSFGQHSSSRAPRIFGNHNNSFMQIGKEPSNHGKSQLTICDSNSKRELVAVLLNKRTVEFFDLNSLKLVGSFELPIDGYCIKFSSKSCVSANNSRFFGSTCSNSNSRGNFINRNKQKSTSDTADLLIVGCEDSKLVVLRI
ncbi:Neurobeachin-like protein 2 [Smittium culicis]|uniref:Beige protein homolog 1 n=1 Tax=Smittium culicis TaxID=133412 RepID=A0A1R1WYS4_9FUNG|nr:Neurobeachin-like protein 2 [Smittium culicis]